MEHKSGEAQPEHGGEISATLHRSLAWLVVAGLLGCGVLARFQAYLADFSLWHDEAALAINIVERSFGGLTRPLDYEQAAPLGFLFAEKLVVAAFGPGEQALRLLPLLAGVASLPLVYLVGRRLLGREPAVVALALLALCAPAIVYSSEAKQYGLDLFVSLCLFALFVEWRAARWGHRWTAAMGFAGAVAVWLSHPSVFVLAAIGLIAFAEAVRSRRTGHAGAIAAAALVWLASFAANYFLVTASIATDPELLEFWRGRFMPFPPASIADVAWLYQKTIQLFKHPVGLKDMPGLGLALALTGLVLLARGRGWLAALFALPLVLALAASAVHKYPFEGRFLMFALPGLAFLIAEGAWFVATRSAVLTRIAPYVLGAVLLAGPLMQFYQQSRWPSEHEDLRAALAGLAAHWREGDAVLLYRHAEPAYRYYREVRGEQWSRELPAPTASFSRVADLLGPSTGGSDLRGRVWLVFSRVGGSRYRGANVEGAVLAALDREGQQLREFTASGVAVHLFRIEPADPPRAVTVGAAAAGREL